MSVPNEGRNSPDPENQSDAQKSAGGDGSIGAAPSETHAKDKSEEVKNELESNPKGPLDDAAKAKTGKDGRGDL